VEDLFAAIVLIMPMISATIVKWENDNFFLQKKESDIYNFLILIA